MFIGVSESGAGGTRDRYKKNSLRTPADGDARVKSAAVHAYATRRSRRCQSDSADLDDAEAACLRERADVRRRPRDQAARRVRVRRGAALPVARRGRAPALQLQDPSDDSYRFCYTSATARVVRLDVIRRRHVPAVRRPAAAAAGGRAATRSSRRSGTWRARASRAWARAGRGGRDRRRRRRRAAVRPPDLVVDEARGFGWDVRTGRASPRPTRADAVHGTASAGVAVARADNSGGCGVAPGRRSWACALDADAGLAADALVADDVFARTVEAFATIDRPLQQLGPARRRPRRRAGGARVVHARRGGSGASGRRGAGQGRRRLRRRQRWALRQLERRRFSAHPDTITVGAIGDDGRRTSYSGFGACLDLVAPSDGGWRRRRPTSSARLRAGQRHGVDRRRRPRRPRPQRPRCWPARPDAATCGGCCRTAPDASTSPTRTGRSAPRGGAQPVVRPRRPRRRGGPRARSPGRRSRRRATPAAPSGTACCRWRRGRRVPLDAPRATGWRSSRRRLRRRPPVAGRRRARPRVAGGTRAADARRAADGAAARRGLVPHAYLTHAALGENSSRDEAWFLETRDVSAQGRLRRGVCARGVAAAPSPAAPPAPPLPPPAGAAALRAVGRRRRLVRVQPRLLRGRGRARATVAPRSRVELLPPPPVSSGDRATSLVLVTTVIRVASLLN